MTSIAIVGAGVAGLHLGLFLQKNDVPVRICTDKTPEQVAGGRLLNTVAHHQHTRERESARSAPTTGMPATTGTCATSTASVEPRSRCGSEGISGTRRRSSITGSTSRA
jgi:hypothetical protein